MIKILLFTLLASVNAIVKSNSAAVIITYKTPKYTQLSSQSATVTPMPISKQNVTVTVTVTRTVTATATISGVASQTKTILPSSSRSSLPSSSHSSLPSSSDSSLTSFSEKNLKQPDYIVVLFVGIAFICSLVIVISITRHITEYKPVSKNNTYIDVECNSVVISDDSDDIEKNNMRYRSPLIRNISHSSDMNILPR